MLQHILGAGIPLPGSDRRCQAAHAVATDVAHLGHPRQREHAEVDARTTTAPIRMTDDDARHAARHGESAAVAGQPTEQPQDADPGRRGGERREQVGPESARPDAAADAAEATAQQHERRRRPARCRRPR